jgi:predicted nuclease of restriction endonuclease-like (RecB) superfamily
MSSEITPNTADYRQWLVELKTRFRQVQLKAAVAVNTAMLKFYWELGADMVAKQTQFAWGSGFLTQLSADLMREFPYVKGFSVRNLKYIRQWHEVWLDAPIGQQAVAQLAQQPVSQILSIPWGHNLAILAKCKQHDEALYYAQAITNFEQALPAAQSDLATQILKDPYKFDFLSLSKEHTERELETDLIAHITQFLLDLGAGLLDDEFLAQVRNLPEKNLAVELLERLLEGEIKSRFASNVVQDKKFSEMLTNVITWYQNRSIETAQVMEELVAMAKKFREASSRGETLGLTEDEVRFYDALANNESAVRELTDETLKKIAYELTENLRQNLSVDWSERTSVRAKLRLMVKRVLRKYKYPPDLQDAAVELVLQQAQALGESWGE